MSFRISKLVFLVSLGVVSAQTSALAQTPTLEETNAFISNAEKELAHYTQTAERALWINYNFITYDTELLSAEAVEKLTAAQVRLAGESLKYVQVEGLSEENKRKLLVMRAGITVPAPADAEKIAEQAAIGANLSGLYGKGQYCNEQGVCKDLQALNDVMAQSRDAGELLEAWEGWRTVSPPMKPLYVRQTELANEGARALGFDDLGNMWRSNYDMPADEFPEELDRLWEQVEPLYRALHCRVRADLGEQYGTDLVSQDGVIPAHLLGNMWAQSWENIYDLVAPEGDEATGYDLNAILQDEGYDAIDMVKTGEGFFSSLGFEKLPATFWERSLFIQPKDRNVVCHASAWNIDEVDDLRIKMCIKVNSEDFDVIHHELGHNYYQRAYKNETFLHRNGANDGFHEAVGDTIALSITPEYLEKIGLLDQVPDAEGDLALLMKRALAKVAFLPFGLMIDQWRWKVFAGEVNPEEYNDLWWSLREKYQGVGAPGERPAGAFDPGAKYHVPGNTPYTRYFLAHILQFQFHRSLCDIAGNTGPIHRCTIYGNAAAGERLNAMLEIGMSKPWPDALEALTGQRKMDATAVLDYFAPLKTWLDEQNQGLDCGW